MCLGQLCKAAWSFWIHLEKRNPDAIQNLIQVEESLVEHLIYCARIGFPLSTLEVQILVHDLVKELSLSTSFVENTPSISWVYRFLGRHNKILRTKTSEHHGSGRAAVTVVGIKGWCLPSSTQLSKKRICCTSSKTPKWSSTWTRALFF